MATVADLLTAEDFFEFCQRPENRQRRFELERGEVVELPPTTVRHGVVCGNCIWLLGTYVREQNRGYIASNDAGLVVEREPDTVYGPDIFLFDEATAFDALPAKWEDRPPALVVEIVSPSDRPGRVLRRVTRFLKMGVPLVWVLDPETQSVVVYRSGQNPVTLERSDELTGADVLPHLRLRVADFFATPADAPNRN
jgi:Uma2 family endonuclease